MNQKIKKYAVWLPALLTAAAIFYFSAQPADISTGMSDGVSRLLLKIGSFLHITGNIQDYHKILEIMSTPVRKSAHIAEYLFLYGTMLFALYHWDLRRNRLIWTAYALTVLYACTDEFHQLFVPGCSGQFTDVLIDGSGAFLIALTAAIYYLFHKKLKSSS